MKLLTGVTISFLISIGANATNYVVIGAFAQKGNAEALAKKEQNAAFEINPMKQLYYVFVMTTDDHEAALVEARRLQRESAYKDAWVFNGSLGEGGHGVDVSPTTEKPLVIEQPKEDRQEVVAAPPREEAQENRTDTALDPKAMSKDFYFNVIYEDGSKADGAEITVIEPRSQRKEYVVKGNENFTMKAINQTGDVRLECDLVGYRKIITTINFKDPSTIDGVAIQDNRIVVPFHLVRLKKGDISVLYNVFFYKDAAIMRPESKFDLDGLLAMMNDNPKYKIRIHGHTNGSAAGKILEVGESGDFFSINGAKEGNGSAKKLSAKRAEVISAWLAKQGIDPSRMSTKAWGGKKPIYDKLHTQAHANVRVEVEVLEE